MTELSSEISDRESCPILIECVLVSELNLPVALLVNTDPQLIHIVTTLGSEPYLRTLKEDYTKICNAMSSSESTARAKTHSLVGLFKSVSTGIQCFGAPSLPDCFFYLGLARSSKSTRFPRYKPRWACDRSHNETIYSMYTYMSINVFM